MTHIGRLSGLVGLIAGGASGLGRATAERFIKQGAKVVLCDLPTSEGSVVSDQLGQNCVFAPADVLSTNDVQKALKTAKDKFNRLDIVVNCAAVAVAFEMFNFHTNVPHKFEDFHRVMMINVAGTFNVTRLAAGVIGENEPNGDGYRGIIVNTTSGTAFEAQRGMLSYAAASGALASMTLPLARDLSTQGIRVVSIAPGVFKTEMMTCFPEKIQNFIASTIPFPKRLGNPDEFSHMVQCVIENPLINGEVIRLDGGQRFTL